MLVDVEETLLGSESIRLRNLVEEGICKYNKTRGRRKELSIEFVNETPYPGRLYGQIVVDWDGSSTTFSRIAGAVVRTLLRRRCRPSMACLSLHHLEGTGHLVRLALPKPL